MRRASLARLIARAFTVAFFAFVLPVSAATLEGRIVGVADGDTVTLLDGSNVQHKIRLAGIDAPESKQDFGNRSKQSLSDLVFAKAVTVETSKKDRYGRLVDKVLVDGIDANLRQVERGLAWHYKEYEREQSPNDRKLYEAAERDAKSANRGLWGDYDPIPPWDWRKARSEKSKTDGS